MIFITGDCHGEFNRFKTEYFSIQKELTKDDYVIICGDFGGIWDYTGESGKEKYWLDWLEKKPFTVLFIDGNHENFDRLYNDYTVKKWHGGKVHEIRPSVLHLMRGEIFNIDGWNIFAFGGASSHDVSDGILEWDKDLHNNIRKLEKSGHYMYRIKGMDWWERELPTEEEMENGLRNLEKYNNQVDFILTHSPSSGMIALLGHGIYKQDILTRYLEDIRYSTNYKKWFCGHMHIDKAINDKDICLYETITQIPPKKEYIRYHFDMTRIKEIQNEFGFSIKNIIEALELCNEDYEIAIEYLKLKSECKKRYKIENGERRPYNERDYINLAKEKIRLLQEEKNIER